MLDDDFVTIRRLHDPLQAQLLVDLLEQAGVPATAVGVNHRGLLGMVGSFIDLPLQVRAVDREHALEVLESLHAVADNTTEELVAAQARPARLKRVACFAAFILPGGAHFYVRSPLVGGAIVAGQALSVVLALGGNFFSLALMPALVLADVLGAMSQIEDSRSPLAGGRITWKAARLAPWLALVGIAAPPALLELVPGSLIGAEGRTYCRRLDQCGAAPYRECAATEGRLLARGRGSYGKLASCADWAAGTACGDMELTGPLSCRP